MVGCSCTYWVQDHVRYGCSNNCGLQPAFNGTAQDIQTDQFGKKEDKETLGNYCNYKRCKYIIAVWIPNCFLGCWPTPLKC